MKYLRSAVDFRASEILGLDLLLGLGGGTGGALLGVKRFDVIQAGLPVAAGLVGVIIGAVLAGVAVQAAFMDQQFLRRVEQIGRKPVRYLAPFLFTAAMGVLASLSLIVVAFTTGTANAWMHGVEAGVAGFLSVYTLASLLPALDALVQFIDLKSIAALAEPELPITRLPKRESR